MAHFFLNRCTQLYKLEAETLGKLLLNLHSTNPSGASVHHLQFWNLEIWRPIIAISDVP